MAVERLKRCENMWSCDRKLGATPADRHIRRQASGTSTVRPHKVPHGKLGIVTLVAMILIKRVIPKIIVSISGRISGLMTSFTILSGTSSSVNAAPTIRCYERVAESLARVSAMTVSDLSVDVIGDVACAYCTFHFEGDPKGESHLRVVEGRNTFILHRKSGTWKVIHYHESRPLNAS